MSDWKLPENMRHLREINGYSQQYVSSKIHVARQTYSIYETGKRLPDIETLSNLARLYHISLDYLVYTDLTKPQITDSILRDHGALTPDNSLLRLTGAEAKMLMDYRTFPADYQREVREFVRFKKYLLSRES